MGFADLAALCSFPCHVVRYGEPIETPLIVQILDFPQRIDIGRRPIWAL